jgi:hypothetical protein
MSSPARKLPRRSPSRAPSPGRGKPGGAGGAVAHRRAQRVDGAKRPLRSRPRPATTPRRRKKHHLGFAVTSSMLVGLMVLGIVVLNVLLAQQSFRIQETERRIDALGRERLGLVREQATLSAPGRIAGWASRHGMRLPDDIRILRAPDGPPDPAGTGTSRASGTNG